MPMGSVGSSHTRSPTAYWPSNRMKKPATTSDSSPRTAKPSTRMTKADPEMAATLPAPKMVATMATIAVSTTV